MKRSHLLTAASVALLATLALAGCSVIPDAAAKPAPSASAGARGLGGGAVGAFPGASCQGAQIDGSTAQVQSRSSQTAVTWTDATTFTDQVASTSSAVAVGDCIVARPATSTGGGTSSGSTGTIAAATIEITPKTDGRCTAAGFGGGRGVQPGIRPTQAPGQSQGGGTATPPAGRGSGGFGGAGFGATGEVTAISAGAYTVSVERFSRNATASPAPSASPQTTTETVSFSSDTTFTALRSATASSVKVGVCVTALGKTDDTGALTATSIAVSQPVDGACSSGFGGLGGRGGQAGSGSNGSTGSGTTNG